MAKKKRKPAKQCNANFHVDHTSVASETPGVSENERAVKQADELIQQGVEAKRDGRYREALGLYERAVDIAPGYLHTYPALGKTHYLIGDRESSLVDYTIASHLTVGLGPSLGIADERSQGFRARVLEALDYPETVLKQVRSLHPHADLLLADPNTPRHLGHTLIDLTLTQESPTELHEYASGYRQSIGGARPLQLDAPVEVPPEVEASVYRPVGLAFLLHNILWDKVGHCSAEEVRQLYIKPSERLVSSVVYDAEFAFVLDILSRKISMTSLSTKEPFADLVNELNGIWLRIDDAAKADLSAIAKQAIQASTSLVGRPYNRSMGALLLQALNQSTAFRSVLIAEWTDSSRLLQTPAVDFLFRLAQEAAARGVDAPVLQTLASGLRCQAARDLRNGLVHSHYSWGTSPTGDVLNIMDRRTNKTVRTLDAETCQAFHGLTVTCALALERFAILQRERSLTEQLWQPVASKRLVHEATVNGSRVTGVYLGVCNDPRFFNRGFCHITTVDSEITLWADEPRKKMQTASGGRVWRGTFTLEVANGVPRQVKREFAMRTLEEGEVVAPDSDGPHAPWELERDEVSIDGLLKVRTGLLDYEPLMIGIQSPPLSGEPGQ